MRLALALALLLAPAHATAELLLPPGFTAQVYVTGEGFHTVRWQSFRGIPATSTLAFDDAGFLYLARNGRRYFSGQVEDLWPIYRIPPGGARLTPDTEARYFHGPPLWNAQVAAIRAGREVFLTTFDRERKTGVLYRLLNGRAEFFAGGTPQDGTPPLLRQPEGAAVDVAGNVYVADRLQGVVIRLDPFGRVLDPRYVAVSRPRVLAVDGEGQLWVASDGFAEAPWGGGPGAIWRVGPDGMPRLVLHGPIAGGMSLAHDSHLFVGDRQAGEIFAIDPAGNRTQFARFTFGDAPRTLGFAPVTPETRRLGIAGDLFVVTIARGAWPVNEILRISGPFEEFLRNR